MISLFPHQQEALQETKDFDNIAVYHDMGLGKTFTGSEMMKRFGCKVNLIVCQKSKVQDWVEHFTDNYQMQVFDLTNKKQLGEYHGLSQGQRFFIVGVINYELAWRRKELLDLYDFTLMLDESSLIQNQKAKQTKFILKMKPAHVILLSGTPVGGKYENLWTQVHLLGWKISEDLYNRQYVNWTTIDSGGFQHKIVDKEDPYKNIDRLKSKMREHGAIFKKTEECYELPEQVFTHIRLKAPKEYWKFQKDYFCDKKDTCNDVCQDIAKVCEEQVEETDLQVIESTVPDVLKAITDITVQKKKLEEQEKLMKEKLLQAMEEHGVKSFENAKVKFMYVAPTTRTTIDSKKLKADHPDIAKAYSKTSNVSASVRITVK